MDRTRSTLLMRVRDPADAEAWGEFVALDEPLLTADRDTERGGVRPLADLPLPLEAACRALQAGPGIESIRALAFPVAPRGSGWGSFMVIGLSPYSHVFPYGLNPRRC
jgi:hypothetical protein